MLILRLIGVIFQTVIHIGLEEWNEEVNASRARRVVTNATAIFIAIIYQMVISLVVIQDILTV